MQGKQKLYKHNFLTLNILPYGTNLAHKQHKQNDALSSSPHSYPKDNTRTGTLAPASLDHFFLQLGNPFLQLIPFLRDTLEFPHAQL